MGNKGNLEDWEFKLCKHCIILLGYRIILNSRGVLKIFSVLKITLYEMFGMVLFKTMY